MIKGGSRPRSQTNGYLGVIGSPHCTVSSGSVLESMDGANALAWSSPPQHLVSNYYNAADLLKGTL